jgi:hypothetical protein
MKRAVIAVGRSGAEQRMRCIAGEFWNVKHFELSIGLYRRRRFRISFT